MSTTQINCTCIQHVDLPSSLFKKKIGFSFDFGGSVMKIVYTSDEGNHVRFHFISFPREKRKEAFQFLHDKFSSLLSTGEEVITCGLGGNEFNTELSEEFNIKVKNISELECLVDGFMFLARHCSFDDFVLPEDKAITRKMVAEKNGAMEAQNAWSGESGRSQKWTDMNDSGDDVRWRRSSRVEYPVMLYSCGSSALPIQVNKDGTYMFCDFTPICGKSLMGLGSLLADVKSYEELVSLAEKGENNKIDTMPSSLGLDDSDPTYNSMTDFKRPVFLLGQTVWKGKDDFSREDLALSAFTQIAITSAMICHVWSMLLKTGQVYFIGGVNACSSVFRRILSEEMQFRTTCNSQNAEADFMFVRIGAHLGAFGSLLQNLELQRY